MKKLFLSGALALCAAAGYAQNSATVTQNGTSQSATANQTGSSLTATISQVGTTTNNMFNTGTVSQTGTGHSATINQDNGSMYNRAFATQKNGTTAGATGANSATISQSNGSGGAAARGGDRSIVTGDLGNYSGTFQTGSGNKATVNQDGPNSKANLGEITQQGSTNTGTIMQSNVATSNVAQILQGVEPAPVVDVTGNNATINQDAGSRNDALVKQLSNTNTATVLQNTATSTDNKAFVTQGDGTNVTGQASNTAAVNQTGASTFNSASVVQTGTLGRAFVTQNDAAGASSLNEAFINQIEGSGSYANIYQTGASSNTATINQHGDGMQADIAQFVSNTSNVAKINQGSSASIQSDGSRAYIYQIGGVASSTAIIDQNLTVDGVSNLAAIDQRGGATSLNMAHIMQEGSYNEAGLVQTGAGSNTATVSQKGNYNVVGGPGHSNYYDPASSSAVFARAAGQAQQDGSSNKMTVMQESTGAPTTLTLYNNAILNQVGTGNILTVDQTLSAGATAGNMATANQTGMGNLAIVQQTAMP